MGVSQRSSVFRGGKSRVEAFLTRLRSESGLCLSLKTSKIPERGTEFEWCAYIGDNYTFWPTLGAGALRGLASNETDAIEALANRLDAYEAELVEAHENGSRGATLRAVSRVHTG